jgi:NAD(P)-dependent dehydrogenase (short-subunit alcohol dehydrogenase family)
MVALTPIKSSLTKLPKALTAVFVGGTSGIGLYTLQTLAKYCAQPTIYFVGRSQSAATTILSQLKTINASGTYHFIQADVALVKNVDKVCAEITAKEKYINMLVLSQGALSMGTNTEEGLRSTTSLILHSRTRFALNLLPLLRAAPQLRRVLSVFCGTKEGAVADPTDLEMWHIKNPMKARGQAASMLTLMLEEVAKRAPEVSFVHDFPGFVRSGAARGSELSVTIMRWVYYVVGPLIYVPEEEVGERHLFLATSARFAAAEGDANGVEFGGKGGDVAVGSEGRVGSGVYVADEKCESAGQTVLDVLKTEREKGTREAVWGEMKKDLLRITGKEYL